MSTTVPGALAPGSAVRGLHPAPTQFGTLVLGSLGVVYGGIGTSPLYALRESLLAAAAGGAPTRGMVLGIVSLVLWALTVIVTVKYVLILLRAANNGEGGTLSLVALAQRGLGHRFATVSALGMAGAALFYGDAMITPAISVLSAVEGLALVTPAFGPYLVPLSLAILIGLFVVQSRGTAAVANLFGPIMSVWFGALAWGGLLHIADDPEILAAVNPLHGIRFLASHGVAGLVALGAVFLAVTGAEALYADLGHFSREPIRFAWLAFVFPALALNYLGQGALLLATPEALASPFFLLYPGWALLPMVGLATLASVVASQAVITGAFSLTQQAMQLGLLPRLEVRRTSETGKGQIYIPRVNGLLLVAVVLLVLAFKSSSALAAAYGIAVTGTMLVTAALLFLVMRTCWRWSFAAAALVIAPFLIVDLVFLGANLLKVLQGGWMPVAVGAVLMLLMATWRRGTTLLAQKAEREQVPLDDFVRMIELSPPTRVQGTAVFFTGAPDRAPTSLLHNLKHNRVLHERNIVLTVVTEDRPRVPEQQRVTIERIGDSFVKVFLRFGYMEEPNVPRALAICRGHGLKFDVMATSFILSRRSIRPAANSRMPRWQDKLFVALSRRASDATLHFSIPTSRAVEVGTQVTV